MVVVLDGDNNSLSPGQTKSQVDATESVENLGLLATPFAQGLQCTCVDMR